MRSVRTARLATHCCLILSIGAVLQPPLAAETGCTRTEKDGIVWRDCAGGSVWIIETRRPLALFHATRGVPTLREHVAESPEAIVAVNGSYHDGNYARPVFEGLLEADGVTLGTLRADDRQLTHVMSIDPEGRITTILSSSEAPAARPVASRYRVQSGPLILNDGALSAATIAGSVNGVDAYKRTAIGRTRAGETVIVVAKTPRTLADLGRLVLRIEGFADRGLTLLNLDGGPSTAIHSLALPGVSYGADKVTPVGFAIR